MENISLRKLVDDNGVLVIPDSVTSIKNRSLSLTPELKELVIGKNVRDIEAYAFSECYNLKKVTILSKEVVIYPNAFKDCIKLEEFDFSKVITISHHSFENCVCLKEVKLSSKLDILSETAFLGCKGIEYFDIPKQNKDFVSCDGVVYSKDLSKLLFYPCAKKDKVFNLSDEVNVISANAFSYSQYLEEVDLKNVSELGISCFKGCSNLKKVKMSSKAKYINQESFKDCLNLIDINVPDNIKIISGKAFMGCKSLKEINIGSNVNHIGDEAFKDCDQLEKLSLPKTIEKLGKNFIGGVKEDLEILYDGTIEEWNNLVKDRNVCVSHQTQNDFHYYGDDVDKYVPDVWEKEIVIPEGFKYKLTVKK